MEGFKIGPLFAMVPVIRIRSIVRFVMQGNTVLFLFGVTVTPIFSTVRPCCAGKYQISFSFDQTGRSRPEAPLGSKITDYRLETFNLEPLNPEPF